MFIPLPSQTRADGVTASTVATVTLFRETVALVLAFGWYKPASTTGASSPVAGLVAHATVLEANVLPLGPTWIEAADAVAAPSSAVTSASASTGIEINFARICTPLLGD